MEVLNKKWLSEEDWKKEHPRRGREYIGVSMYSFCELCGKRYGDIDDHKEKCEPEFDEYRYMKRTYVYNSINNPLTR